MMTLLRAFFLLSITWLLSSCAGYQMGGSKPPALAHVTKIQVPMAENDTQMPRAAAFVTNNVVDAILRDGTYGIGTEESAQAVLEVKFREATYSSIRNDTENRLRPVEMSMTVFLSWKVLDAANPSKVLDAGTSQGRTTLFVDPNLQTARQTALNDALQRASTSMISRLANGF